MGADYNRQRPEERNTRLSLLRVNELCNKVDQCSAKQTLSDDTAQMHCSDLLRCTLTA